MSLIIRSLLRDPLNPRPISRALRRLEDDFWLDDWRPVKRMRRLQSPRSSLVDHMDRQVTAAFNQMQELADDINQMESLISRYDVENWPERSTRSTVDNCIVKRTESGGLQLSLDVGEFKPEDLKISLVDDNHLVIEATSESSGENSYQKSHFKRWFKLPDDCKLDQIKSKLTEDKKLLVELPTNKPLKDRNSRTIPIEMADNPTESSQSQENQTHQVDSSKKQTQSS